MALRPVTLALAVAMVASTASGAHARPDLPPSVAKLYQSPPTIELVTMGIGSLIWERHGHIALCVRYENHRQDACYNYGIGDFHDPIAMAWGFFRGTHSFWVGKMNPDQMLSIYEYADRTVWVQPLPLTDDQKQKILVKLESDILEENRYYAYDHFADNCTTRIRDIIDNATGGALSSMTDQTDGKTFRDLARDGFFGMRIPLLITDIAMGRSTDRVPTYWERMFLPQYLREAVAKKFGVEPIVVYQRHGPPPLDDGPSGRVLFAFVILLLTAPAWLTRRIGRFQRTGLAVALAPYVLLGSVLWFLAIISPLPYVRWQETCLVLFPFDLAVLFLSPVRRRLYARGRVAMLGAFSLLMAVGVFTQPLGAPLLWPLIPMLVVGFWPDADVAGATAAAEASEKPATAKPKRQKNQRRS
jgi:hypothetical protein